MQRMKKPALRELLDALEEGREKAIRKVDAEPLIDKDKSNLKELTKKAEYLLDNTYGLMHQPKKAIDFADEVINLADNLTYKMIRELSSKDFETWLSLIGYAYRMLPYEEDIDRVVLKEAEKREDKLRGIITLFSILAKNVEGEAHANQILSGRFSDKYGIYW